MKCKSSNRPASSAGAAAAAAVWLVWGAAALLESDPDAAEEDEDDAAALLLWSRIEETGQCGPAGMPDDWLLFVDRDAADDGVNSVSPCVC